MTLFKKKKDDISDLPKPSLDLGIEKFKFPDLPKFPEPELKRKSPLYEPTITPRSVTVPKEERVEEEEEETEVIRERPLFIKIEKYEDAMRHMDEVKNRIKDAGKILDNLSSIKMEEDNEIKKWQDDLISIKNKLMRIDKNLFGA